MLYVHIIEKSFLAQVVPLFHHRDFLNCRPHAQKMHIQNVWASIAPKEFNTPPVTYMAMDRFTTHVL